MLIYREDQLQKMQRTIEQGIFSFTSMQTEKAAAGLPRSVGLKIQAAEELSGLGSSYGNQMRTMQYVLQRSSRVSGTLECSRPGIIILVFQSKRRSRRGVLSESIYAIYR